MINVGGGRFPEKKKYPVQKKRRGQESKEGLANLPSPGKKNERQQTAWKGWAEGGMKKVS